MLIVEVSTYMTTPAQTSYSDLREAMNAAAYYYYSPATRDNALSKAGSTPSRRSSLSTLVESYEEIFPKDYGEWMLAYPRTT